MTSYFDAAALIEEISKKYNFDTETGQIEKVTADMSSFRLKILFSGGFSTGKSAAINTLLDRSLLKEALTPETAIASELIYDEDEYVEAVSQSGRVRMSINEAESIDTSLYEYLIWHINCDNLKKINKYTIVDMPGFNSGIENHNKAILRYAGNGNAYILVIDCEGGEIQESLALFMEEIRNYNNNIAIAVSKTDKKSPELVDEVAANIANSAEDIFGEPVNVIKISKYDKETPDKLIETINGFDSEDIFKQTFKPQIFDIGSKCLFGLSGIKRGANLDESEIQKEIKHHLEVQIKLEQELEREKEKLATRMRKTVRPQILNDVREALTNRIDELTNAILQGGNAFSSRVNGILRSTLANSTKQYVEQSFYEFAEGLDLSSLSETTNMDGFNSSDAIYKLNKMKNTIDTIVNANKDYGPVYKAITTTLSVIFTTIAPWLELIIIFMPEVVSLFSSIIGKFQEKKVREETKDKLINEIIPMIISRLEPAIDESLEKMQDDMVSDVSKSINERIQIEIDGLNKAKKRLEESRREFENELAEIDSYIAQLTGSIDSL